MEEMDVWQNNIQQDLQELKSNQTTMQTDIHKLQTSDQLQNQEIATVKATLKDISDDTKWIRRMITKSVVGAIITGVIGGIVALLFTQF